MSDITKKIFSIEQAMEGPNLSKTSISDLIRPLSIELNEKRPNSEDVDVPDFVTRDPIEPRSLTPTPIEGDIQPPKTIGWVIFGFAILYLIGAGLYFGLPLISEPVRLLSIAGLVLVISLPIILLLLLWRSLHHLTTINLQNNRLSKAAAILVSPDREALARTESLASGIQTQISQVNKEMQLTVEAMKAVKIAVKKESKALDIAGIALTKRSNDVGRNLKLQRQALDSMAGTFDTRISTLSTQITKSGKSLDQICTTAETKLLQAGDALEKASIIVGENVTAGTTRLDENIETLDKASVKLNESVVTITSDLNTSTETLQATDGTFSESSTKLSELNAQTQSQISELQAAIGHGYEMMADLKAETETRALSISSYYEDFTKQIKRTEDETLSAQNETVKLVQSNLAQIRREFSRMETDLQTLQSKLGNLRDSSQDIPTPEPTTSRLNLMPLDTDFPPVEPPRPKVRPERIKLERLKVEKAPLNLGMDLEIPSNEDPLINFEPEVIRRPGAVIPKSKSKGFGRRTDTDEKSGWHWRDMLGTLDRPNPNSQQASTTQATNGVTRLTEIKLSPSAIVDEGTVLEAAKGQMNNGITGLTSAVNERLPEAVTHLKENLQSDVSLQTDLQSFTSNFASSIGNTPPTAPALRAIFSSPEGKAYLLCAAALKSTF